MALTRDLILDTAFTLLRQYGLADLSMRRLATELGVAPGALYYYIKNKQELLASLASRMVQGVPFPVASGPDGGARKSIEGALVNLYSSLIPVKEASEVVRLALALHPQALPQDRLPFLGELETRLAEQVGSANSALAAETLLHVALGFIEQEQTRALLTGTEPFPQAPEYYRQAVRATLAGFTAPVSN